MWHLKSIRAKNLCSFLEMEYSLKQGAATLIFGNNQDSDSQNSNGSGKSALIEAIAIALTGEPLRKVNADEIINDTHDEAVVSAVLYNDMLGEQMTINRLISRKLPQQISVIKQTGPYDTDTEEIPQATVADYNKYILDQLGLTKDDIFANFILTARKYKSFLACPDKEKKEIINRFSNGVLVDESIEKLHADIAPVQIELNTAEKNVATCVGRVEALASEIEKAINDADSRRANKESQIKNWESLIASKRSEIRTLSDQINETESSLDKLDELDPTMQDLEESDVDVEQALSRILKLFKDNQMALSTDYTREMQVLNTQLETAVSHLKTVTEQVDKFCTELKQAEEEYVINVAKFNERKSANEVNREECADKIQKILATVQRIDKRIDKLTASEREAKAQESERINQLSGVIKCPKCQYEFVLNSNVNVEWARQSLASIQGTLARLAKDIQAANEDYNKSVAEGKNQREIEAALETERRDIENKLREAEESVVSARSTRVRYEKQIEEANSRISDIQGKMSRIRTRIFDEAFETIDNAYKNREAKIKSFEEHIATLKGSIASYDKAIEEARNATEENILASLKRSQEDYRKEHQAAVATKNEIEGRLNELKAQEQTFIEFKTYLANTKISAISQITNEFLETIGSDIRVALSGYTVLKSGKVRDKISVSLLRDGMDCGSFEKFSAGERVRVELASILSMNKLTNMNCDEGKGLDLLIADEVLDSADEQGLASVFKALNQTQLTSLVVSHGNVHEGYPNRITVTKSNGVSSIHETSK